MDSAQVEIAVARYIGIRRNIIVPNIFWGLFTYELDLFVMTPSRKGWEIEIKVSKSDLIKDKEKRHGHKNLKIKRLYFAMPQIMEKYIEYVPSFAGILLVSENGSVKKIREAKNKSNYTFTEVERNLVLRLCYMRVWDLKKNFQYLKQKIIELKNAPTPDTTTEK